jgi:hypothetical protein
LRFLCWADQNGQSSIIPGHHLDNIGVLQSVELGFPLSYWNIRGGLEILQEPYKMRLVGTQTSLSPAITYLLTRHSLNPLFIHLSTQYSIILQTSTSLCRPTVPRSPIPWYLDLLCQARASSTSISDHLSRCSPSWLAL